MDNKEGRELRRTQGKEGTEAALVECVERKTGVEKKRKVGGK